MMKQVGLLASLVFPVCIIGLSSTSSLHQRKASFYAHSHSDSHSLTRLHESFKACNEEPQFSSYSDFSDPELADYGIICSRFLTLTHILLSDVIFPLGKSATNRQLNGNNYKTSFWADQDGGMSNAQRISLAIEKMGPTFVKFGQALSSRSDIIGVDLARALSSLQDNMDIFDTSVAKKIIKHDLAHVEKSGKVNELISSMADTPVAAASIGQVYRAFLTDYGAVAIKVKRPGIVDVVESDAQLLRFCARIAEGLPFGIIKTELVNGVNEFMTRLFEELDYERERNNAMRFADLYSVNGGTARNTLPSPYPGVEPGVIVPEMISELCSTNVLTMTWVDGKKLVDLNVSQSIESSSENLSLLVQGIQCTLSQILETGVMHADPHGANLLKVSSKTTHSSIDRLAYIDFGILADVPSQVRDGLVCAVSCLIFQRNIKAVASLFGELRLIPEDVINDPIQLGAFTKALQEVADSVLLYNDSTNIPSLQFNKLLEGLVGLVPRFQFQLPPYFLNNARALGTLEGMARSIDSDFNVLSVVYPFALQRLMKNPSGSPIVDQTLKNLICNDDGTIDRVKATTLLRDASTLSGVRRRVVIRDILQSKGGRKFLRSLGRDEVKNRIKRASTLATLEFEMLRL